MGHYSDVKFDVELNDIGVEIISSLMITKNWNETIKEFPQHEFLKEINSFNFENFSFGQRSDLKDGESSWLDSENVWHVFYMFKWRGEDPRGLLKFLLPYLIKKPEIATVEHELWDSTAICKVEPRVTIYPE